MTVDGVVREWHEDQGWGVLETAATPGGCWAHFSAAAVAGYASFTPGEAVRVEFESADQDGYAHRATRFWSASATPVDRVQSTETGAYTSTLHIDFD